MLVDFFISYISYNCSFYIYVYFNIIYIIFRFFHIRILCSNNIELYCIQQFDVWYYKIVTINKYGVKYEFYMILLPLRVNIKWPSNHSHRKQYCGIMYIRFRNTWFQFYFIYYKVTKEHFTICTWVIKRNQYKQ